METMIKIENAAKRFKDKMVFEKVNIDIEKGSSVGFVGHNGCGKSVLLKCICGFSLLTEGKIFCGGKEIGRDIDFIENAGVIIEAPEFIGGLSGYKNLKAIAEIRGEIDDARIFKIMKLLDLYEDRDKKVWHYSLGMKQKLRIAQAIMESPRILILDESTNGLDKENVQKVRRILKSFVDRGGTLVLASHNKADIEFLCDRVYAYEHFNFI